MTTLNTERSRNVSGRKKENFDRDRVEFKADPTWIKRATEEANRSGFGTLSAFVRFCVTQYMDAKDAERRDSKSKR